MGYHLKNLVQIIHITPRSLYEIPNNRLTSIDIMFANIYWIEIQVKAFLFWWLMTFWGFDSSAASCSTLQHNLNIGRGIHRHSFLGASIQRFAEKYITPTVLFLEKEMLNIAVTSRPAETGKKRLISESVRGNIWFQFELRLFLGIRASPVTYFAFWNASFPVSKMHKQRNQITGHKHFSAYLLLFWL